MSISVLPPPDDESLLRVGGTGNIYNMTPADRDALAKRVLALYADNYGIREISALVGRAYGTVHAFLVANGAELRSRGGDHGSAYREAKAARAARAGGAGE